MTINSQGNNAFPDLKIIVDKTGGMSPDDLSQLQLTSVEGLDYFAQEAARAQPPRLSALSIASTIARRRLETHDFDGIRERDMLAGVIGRNALVKA